MKLPKLRKEILKLRQSEIREVANESLSEKDIIPLWFGEDDLPTDEIIINEGIRALRSGKTHYTENKGIPTLCKSISTYLTQLHQVKVSEESVLVTASAMNALMLTAEAIIEPKTKVISVTPVWPNFIRCVDIMGGEVIEHTLQLINNKWELDVNNLIANAKKAKAIYINSPNNPTGWMMKKEDQIKLLNFCKKERIWLIADEVYSRIVYDRKYAPSFLDIYQDGDPLIVINSFSKTWSMTGWRIGWMVLPKELTPIFEKLVEFNIASSPSISQIASITALNNVDNIINKTIERFDKSRTLVINNLNRNKNISYGHPESAFYVFFKIRGVNNGLNFCKNLLKTTGVGLAPGIAFGKSNENYIRLCYAKSEKIINEAFKRMEVFLNE